LFILWGERKCDSGKVPTTEEEIRKYFEHYSGQDIVVAVGIGNPTFWFCDILEGMGIESFIVNTLEYNRTSNSKKKNDKLRIFFLTFFFRCVTF
jgi:hypothetical protein